MSTHLKLQDVVEALELGSQTCRSYVHRSTMTIVLVTDDMAMGPDGELNPEEIEGSDDYLPLPTSFDIDEWSMMKQFADCRSESHRDKLCDAITGRGAFRRFRDAVRRMGIEDEWYRFRGAALEAAAKEWLEEQRLPYEQ
jgi:hypothetical protein